ncbi:hypothetical protein [[Phormidium] sp. ETS-05]|uniref:hypothetical protein n=1 Tax=[Phormidium] sp. ETS-05 TaxID=222819 RepID=UPI0018EECED3|nr:hypothetical protein [[Phormidium] sp. ETS-05]
MRKSCLTRMRSGVAFHSPDRRARLENYDIVDVDLTLLDDGDDAQICSAAAAAAAVVPIQGAATGGI